MNMTKRTDSTEQLHSRTRHGTAKPRNTDRNMDKAVSHTPVSGVMPMEFPIPISEKQIAEFKAAIKAGVYQQLLQDDLITQAQADKLLSNLAAAQQKGGQTNVK